jgi:hypothetical protein
MIEINEFDNNQKIAESTKLIRYIFDNNFTKRQLDMVYAIISLVKPTDDDFKTYHISYSAIGKIAYSAKTEHSLRMSGALFR